MTAPRTLGLEDLIRLIDDLRLAGYDIGTQQYINAQRLLIALAAHGRHPASPLDLRPLLAPVLCSSRKEQENFYEYFPQWLARLSHIKGKEPNEKPLDPQSSALPGRVRLQLRSHVRLIIGAVLLLAGLPALLLLIRPSPAPTLSGAVVSDDDNDTLVAGAQITLTLHSGNGDTSPAMTTNAEGKFSFTYSKQDQPVSLTVSHDDYTPQTIDVSSVQTPITITLKKKVSTTTPTTNPTVSPAPQPSSSATTTTPSESTTVPPPPGPMPAVTPSLTRYFDLLRLVALVLPIVIFSLWWLVRLYRQRRMLLQKKQRTQQPRLEQLIVKGAAEQLFQGQAFRRTVQELRRHRRRGSRDLDEQVTIEATIRRGGLFMPFYGSRKTLPEYLALIERVSARDQQARFEEELVHRLVQDSIIVDEYYFRGDPLICRKKGDGATRSATYVTLPDLAALHPDYYLLIFSDGASFIDSVTGEPEHWLEQFSPWAGRAILTPESPAHWRYREWILQESDFLILPVGKEGLAALGEAINTGTPPAFAESRDGRSHPFPAMLRERPQRWLEDHEPPPDKVARLFEQLTNYFGKDGLNWLAACAVYPALHWDLTLYLGFELIADREEFERKLLKVVSLPWLRYGSMPDWFRAKLITSLTPAGEQIVRQSLEKLLVTFLNPPPDGVHLDYATRQKDTTGPRGWPGAWHKLRQWWRARRRRQKVRELLRTESAESPLQDFVFLTFMSGRRPGPLDVSVPDLLRRVLFPRGLEAFGPRPAAALACTAFIAFGGWATLSWLEPNGLLPPLPVDVNWVNPPPPLTVPIVNLTPSPSTSPSPTTSPGLCGNAPVVSISDIPDVNEGDIISLIAAIAGVASEKYANAPFDWNVIDDTGKPVQFGERPDGASNILIPTAGLGGRTVIAKASIDLGDFGAPSCTGHAQMRTLVKGGPQVGRGLIRVMFSSSRTMGDVLKGKLLPLELDRNPAGVVSESFAGRPLALWVKAGSHRLNVRVDDPRAAGEVTINVIAGQTQDVVIEVAPESTPQQVEGPATPTPTPLLAPPKQIHPGDGSSPAPNKPLRFSWASVRGADSYTIEITCTNQFAQRRCGGPGLTRSHIKDTFYLLDWTHIAAQQSTLTIPVSFSTNALIYGIDEKYSWRVWAVDARGNEGPKSDWWSFEVIR